MSTLKVNSFNLVASELHITEGRVHVDIPTTHKYIHYTVPTYQLVVMTQMIGGKCAQTVIGIALQRLSYMRIAALFLNMYLDRIVINSVESYMMSF